MQTLTKEEAINEIGAHYNFDVLTTPVEQISRRPPGFASMIAGISSSFKLEEECEISLDRFLKADIKYAHARKKLVLRAVLKYGKPSDGKNQYPYEQSSIDTAFEKLQNALIDRLKSIKEEEKNYYSSLSGRFREKAIASIPGMRPSDKAHYFQTSKENLERHIQDMTEQKERGVIIKSRIPETNEYPDTILQTGDKLYVVTEDDPKADSPITIKDFTIETVDYGGFFRSNVLGIPCIDSTKGVRYYAVADDRHIIDVIVTSAGHIQHMKEKESVHQVFQTLNEAEKYADERQVARTQDLARASLNRYRAPSQKLA